MSAQAQQGESIQIIDVIAKAGPYGNSVHYYLILNRQPSWVYSRAGNDLVAHDSGIYDFLAIEPGSSGAFAGREFVINLTDGSSLHCKGQVWACGSPKGIERVVEVGVSTLELLQTCYVFRSASISQAKLTEWLSKNVPSNNYYKYDNHHTLEWVDKHFRSSGRVICANRARKLRRLGVTVWRDETGQRRWSPHYECARGNVIAAISNDPGTVCVGSAL